MSRSLITAAVASTILATTAVASTRRDVDVRTTVVNVGDLDLASGWGVDRTIHRLRAAIDRLCDDDERCRDEAWLSADWQVARNMRAAQWSRGVYDARIADRTRYGWAGDDLPPPPVPDRHWTLDGPPPPPPPASPRVATPDVTALTTTTTTTTVTTTTATTVTLVYRTPPPDYGWYPH